MGPPAGVAAFFAATGPGAAVAGFFARKDAGPGAAAGFLAAAGPGAGVAGFLASAPGLAAGLGAEAAAWHNVSCSCQRLSHTGYLTAAAVLAAGPGAAACNGSRTSQLHCLLLIHADIHTIKAQIQYLSSLQNIPCQFWSCELAGRGAIHLLAGCGRTQLRKHRRGTLDSRAVCRRLRAWREAALSIFHCP